MDEIRELRKGETLDGLPGAMLNYSLRAAKSFNQQLAPQSLRGESLGGNTLTVEIVNVAGESLDAARPIVRLVSPAIAYDDNNQIVHDAILFNADKPDETTDVSNFAVALSPLADDGTVAAVISGPVWCQIDVTDEGHTHAYPVDDDAAKLKSGTSGVEILDKESGTGTKWGLVMLRGGGSGSGSTALAIIKGTVPASSAIDTTGTLTDSTSVATPGKLAVSATSSTFTAGALICVTDGTDVFPAFSGGELRAMDAINPSLTVFNGEGDGVIVAGSIVELDGYECFIIPRFELRTEPGWALGSDPEDDAQGLYHEGGARDQDVGREDCE